MSCRSSKKSIGRQRPAVQHVAGMFAQEPPPDFDVAGRRKPGERPELVAALDGALALSRLRHQRGRHRANLIPLLVGSSAAALITTPGRTGVAACASRFLAHGELNLPVAVRVQPKAVRFALTVFLSPVRVHAYDVAMPRPSMTPPSERLCDRDLRLSLPEMDDVEAVVRHSRHPDMEETFWLPGRPAVTPGAAEARIRGLRQGWDGRGEHGAALFVRRADGLVGAVYLWKEAHGVELG